MLCVVIRTSIVMERTLELMEKDFEFINKDCAGIKGLIEPMALSALQVSLDLGSVNFGCS